MCFILSRKSQFSTASKHTASIKFVRATEVATWSAYWGIFLIYLLFFNAVRIKSQGMVLNHKQVPVLLLTCFSFSSEFMETHNLIGRPERICCSFLTPNPDRHVPSAWKLLSRMKGKSVSLDALFPGSAKRGGGHSMIYTVCPISLFFFSFSLRCASKFKNNMPEQLKLHHLTAATSCANATCISRVPLQSAKAFSSGQSDVIWQTSSLCKSNIRGHTCEEILASYTERSQPDSFHSDIPTELLCLNSNHM